MEQRFNAYDLSYWEPILSGGYAQLLGAHQASLSSDHSVLEPKSIPDLLELFKRADSDLPQDLERILKYSNHLHHPGYMGHQVVPPTLVSVFAGLLSNYLNQGMAVSDMGQSATVVERKVVLEMLKALAWKDGDGIMTSGGSLGNLTALLAARQAKSQAWQDGNLKDSCVLVSADAHYSVDRAVRIMGFGEAGVVSIPVDEHRRVRAGALEGVIKATQAAGKNIIAVVGSACTTGPGVFDDLPAMAKLCKAYDLWFHIDAAHGGMLLLSEKHKRLLRGSELADSMVIDFHKMGFTPALTTTVLFKKAEDSYATFAQDAAYLWGDSDFEPWTQSGLRTVECTKLMMGLKAYANLFWLPRKELVSMMDRLVDQTKFFASEVSVREKWELLQEPDVNILCFRLKDVADAKQYEALKKLVDKGSHYWVSTKVDGKFYFRITVMNVFSELKHFKSGLEAIEEFVS